MSKPKKLTKKTFNPEAFTFIDLGLPSGRLWATENAPGYYTFDEAVETFGDHLPKGSAMVELIEESTCTWNNEKKGLDIIGPNGNSIFLPATGYTSDSPGVKAKYKEGDYRTRMPYTQTYTHILFFNSNVVHPLSFSYRPSGFSVRLCRESH